MHALNTICSYDAILIKKFESIFTEMCEHNMSLCQFLVDQRSWKKVHTRGKSPGVNGLILSPFGKTSLQFIERFSSTNFRHVRHLSACKPLRNFKFCAANSKFSSTLITTFDWFYWWKTQKRQRVNLKLHQKPNV